MALTECQKKFIDEYLIDLNSTRAYKAAYPSVVKDATAAAGARLLKNVKVSEYLAKRMKDRERRTEITQDKVLNELAAIAFANASDYAKVIERRAVFITKEGKRQPLFDENGKPLMVSDVKLALTDCLSRKQKKAISGIKHGKNGIEVSTCDKGINWEQWQVKQLAALEEFKKRNAAKYGDIFDDINARIESLIKMQRAAGHAEQEVAILKAIQKGAKLKKVSRRQAEINARFFLANDRKINALIQATTADLQRAEYAILRMANDKYRKIIFDAQMYAASGAGTYETAVDMAAKDFLRAGINCVEYSNGARHTASDYADMAIRTASGHI